MLELISLNLRMSLTKSKVLCVNFVLTNVIDEINGFCEIDECP